MLQLQDLNDALNKIEPVDFVPSDNKSVRGSKLLKVKKALETDYRKNILNIVDVEEVNLLKYYFNKIINGSNLTVSEISKVLDEFIEESDNDPYSKVIGTLKMDLTTGKISLDQFFEFIEKFVIQNYPINIFYKKYFKRTPFPSATLVDIFGDNLDDLSSDSEEEAKDEEEVKGESEKKKDVDNTNTAIQIIDPHFEKKRGRIALVKVPEIPKPPTIKPKPVVDKTFFQSMDTIKKKDCEFLYKKLPWVKYLINHVYVHPVEGDFNGILNFEKYIEYEGDRYYSPKESYYNIQCESDKMQEGDVLKIVTKDDHTTYKLKVALDTNSKGIVIQDENMLKAEIDYTNTWKKNKKERIEQMYKNEPSSNMVIFAKVELATALQNAISGNVPLEYRSSNSEFIEKVVKTIKKNSNSGESFVRLLGSIIIFLRINISFISSSVFVKRLREVLYLPKTLPFLTDADKLPEIFLSENVPADTVIFVLKKLEEERIYFTKNFFEDLYINSFMLRKPTKITLWNKPTQQIELPDIKSICKNKKDVENENDEDIVFYTDNNEIYCFNMFDLHSLFQSEEFPKNPYTNRPFSDNFIRLFLNQYVKTPSVKKTKHIKKVGDGSELENLIQQELTMLENNLIETENPTFIAKFKSSVSPPNLNEPKKRISKLPDQNKCAECKKELADSDKIRTVFRNKEIFFCGYDCLEKNKAFK
jgi:hypothetical protein